MQRDLAIYLEDILNAIELIEEFTRNQTKDAYQANRMMQAAVERQFISIGEALSQISFHFPDDKGRVQTLRQAINFRNFLVHEYREVNSQIVWSTITEKLISFKSEIAEWLQDIES